MNHTHILLTLLVVGGIWAKSDDCDLNLESVFRTPKDFSKVNFEHFEILERNNFDHQDAASPVATNDVVVERDCPQKTVANAQVMLRFGGDNIHDCDQVALPSYRTSPLELPPQVPIPVFDEPRYPLYSHYSSAPQSIYHYPPPPPFAFPGYLYGPPSYAPACSTNPFNYSAYPKASYNLYNGQLIPTDERIDLESTVKYYPSEASEESYPVLDGRREFATWAEQSSIPSALDSAEIVEEHIPQVNWLNAHNTPRGPLLQNEYLVSHTPEVVRTVVSTASPAAPLVSVVSPNVVREVTIPADCNPCPKRVSYVEVNLGDVNKSEEQDLPAKSIETLLDQALIPFTCQKCSEKHKLLVSCPIINNEVVTLNNPEDEIEVSGCSRCQNLGTCSSCNRQRNLSIPYGKRFSKDLDSLFEVTTRNAPPFRFIPPSLYKAKFDNMPLKVWSPMALFARKFRPAHITTTSAPCSTTYLSSTDGFRSTSPLCSTGPFVSTSPCSSTSHCGSTGSFVSSGPFMSASPLTTASIVDSSCSPCSSTGTTEFVEVRNEHPCAEPVEVVQACTDSTSTLPKPCDSVDFYPGKYSTGYRSYPESEYFSGIEAPRLWMNEYQTPSGAGYVSGPYKTTLYKQPSIWDFKMPNPVTPVIERQEFVAPYAYNTLPRYDAIPEGNMCSECNTVIPPRMMVQRDFLPATQYVGSGPYVPSWPLSSDAASLVNTRCQSCADKYSGEFNEIESEE